MNLDRFFCSAKDAIWALDYFAVDGWDVDSWWTIRTSRDAMARCKREPGKVVHDHGSHFAG